LKVSFAKIFFLDYPFEKPFDILKLLAELGVWLTNKAPFDTVLLCETPHERFTKLVKFKISALNWKLFFYLQF
jgi:hypothetical protein